MADGITPGRRTAILLDGPTAAVLRPTFRYGPGGSQMGRPPNLVLNRVPKVTFGGETHHVTQWPGGLIGLEPLSQEIWQRITTEYTAGAIGPADVTTATNFRSFKNFRGYTDQPGVNPAAGLDTNAVGWKRQKPASQDWDHADNSLGADMLAVPPPTAAPDLPNIVASTRVMLTSEIYEPNCGFGILLGTPADYWEGDTFCNIYFGGPAPTEPASSFSGHFCLSLRGSGIAVLYEQDQRTVIGDLVEPWWPERERFIWADPQHLRGGSHTIQIIPQMEDRICFVTHTSEQIQPFAPWGLIVPPTVWGRPGKPSVHLYRDQGASTGRRRLTYMTGAGQLRLDVRKNHRHQITPCVLTYPPLGALVDGVFTLPLNADPTVPLRVTVRDYHLLGVNTRVAYKLYDGQTAAELSVNGSGQYLPPESRKVFAVFTLYPSDGEAAFAKPFRQSPLLIDYSIEQEAATIISTDPPVTGGKMQDVSIVGPTLDPTLENCALVVRDPANELSILGDRDRIPMTIRVYTDEDPRGYVDIFQGETFEVAATRVGKPGIGFDRWHDYRALRGMGRFRRDLLNRQVSSMVNYQDSGSIGTRVYDSSGRVLPPKITEVVYDLLTKAGVPADEIDCPIGPDDLRFRPSPRLSPNDDYTIQVGRKGGYYSALYKLVRYILLRFLVRDPNVGERGMWRVIRPPNPRAADPYPDSHVLADFYQKRPDGYQGRSIYPIGALGDTHSTWIRDRSWTPYIRAPEGNYVSVSAWGDVVQATGRPGKRSARAIDLASVDWLAGEHTSFKYDPVTGRRNPSYLGTLADIYVTDTGLVDQGDVDWLTRAIYDITRGQERFSFTAPLLFVNDPNDALLNAGGIQRKRPLRVYDLVRIHTFEEGIRKALIWSCSPAYRFDRVMMAYHEAMFVT